jgi:hypothetical protein
MHSDAMSGCGGAPGMPSREPARPSPSHGTDWCRRHRKTRRWCVLGFILIPVVLAFLWAQYASARISGELLYADQYCGCRETVSRWISDYIWTQMIWLPCNTLFLLIWVALAVKLWSSKRPSR